MVGTATMMDSVGKCLLREGLASWTQVIKIIFRLSEEKASGAKNNPGPAGAVRDETKGSLPSLTESGDRA